MTKLKKYSTDIEEHKLVLEAKLKNTKIRENIQLKLLELGKVQLELIKRKEKKNIINVEPAKEADQKETGTTVELIEKVSTETSEKDNNEPSPAGQNTPNTCTSTVPFIHPEGRITRSRKRKLEMKTGNTESDTVSTPIESQIQLKIEIQEEINTNDEYSTNQESHSAAPKKTEAMAMAPFIPLEGRITRSQKKGKIEATDGITKTQLSIQPPKKKRKSKKRTTSVTTEIIEITNTNLQSTNRRTNSKHNRVNTNTSSTSTSLVPFEPEKKTTRSHQISKLPKNTTSTVVEFGLKQKDYHCSVCDRGFQSKLSLDAHWLIHSGEKKFKCDQCNVSFYQKGNLKTHKLKHTGGKPFKCSICDSKFRQKSHLLNHLRIHNNQRPYICPDCPEAFSQKSNLQEHIKLHNCDNIYKCHHCTVAFGAEWRLKRHLSKH